MLTGVATGRTPRTGLKLSRLLRYPVQQRIGTTDTAELETMFDEREDIIKTEREQAIEECQERIEFCERHNYGSITEEEYDELSRLKDGREP